MRVTLDLDTNTIILPDSYFNKIDAMNIFLKANGGNTLDYLQYIKDSFQKAVETPMKRKCDVTEKRSSKTAKQAK